MPSLNELRDWLNFFCELGILVILVVEYRYDRDWNERDKARRDRRRKKYEFENLTDGEGK